MSKRNWTNIQVKEPLILAMREAGMARQEIADALGLAKQLSGCVGLLFRNSSYFVINGGVQHRGIKFAPIPCSP